VAVAATGFLATTGLAGVFTATAVVAGFLAGAFFVVGVVVGPPAQASAAMAMAAAKVRNFRMIRVIVYQAARTKQ
jgi:hypothetical protein